MPAEMVSVQLLRQQLLNLVLLARALEIRDPTVVIA